MMGTYRCLRSWEEFTGVLRGVRIENGYLLLIFEVKLAIPDFDGDLLSDVKKMLGRKVAILRSDSGEYRIREVME